MKQLHIGIDLTAIWRRPTGIFRYTAEMAHQLLLLSESEPSLRYTLFFSREIHPDFLDLRHTFDSIICPFRNELLIKQCWFPAVLPHLHLDMIHYPTFPPPYIQVGSPPVVMTFYDAGPWRYPQAQTLHGRLYFRTLLARGTRTSARILTLSSHARTEIGHVLGKRYLPKISVAPGAAREAFAEPISELRIRARYRLPSSYLLTVSTVEPRKNLPTLLKAYAQLKQQLAEVCPPLVIVGRKGWNCGDILRYMEALKDNVLFLGHVPDEDLIALYQMATCFVFPSLYEGFGLPVLEAMKAGCPVITTTSSSLPEVAGGAALLVDPLDANGMAAVLQRLLQDESLRRQMIAEGELQAARFSWSQTALLHTEVYLRIACSERR